MALTVVAAILVALSWDGLFTHAFPSADELALQEHVEYLLSQSVPAVTETLEGIQTASVIGQAQVHSLSAVRSCTVGRGLETEWGTKRWKSSVLLRARTDSLSGGIRRAAVFTRVGLEAGPWQAVGMVEKDRHEASLVDFVGGGLRYCSGLVNAVLGNCDFGAGQGLVFSSSYGRSASRLAEGVGSAASLRLTHHADESSPLCGAGVELDMGRWSAAGLWSNTGRDARLNPDGSVEKLEPGGVHADSASLAQRNQVRALLGGGAVRYKAGTAEGGLHFGLVRYSRDFKPSDTSNSFAGRSLANVGVAGGVRFGPWRAEAEAAACCGGLAGAARLIGDWEAVTTRVVLRWHGRRYFAPYSRWTGLSGRNERLYASGALGWKRSGLRVSASGNTYRDFELDSLPARVEFKAGQRLGRFGCDLKLGRSFKLADERYRTAGLEVTVKVGQPSGVCGDLRLAFTDEYPETRPGRGRSVETAGTVRLGLWRLDVALARFDIAGSGIRIYMNEPGAMRIGSSYSTARSAWRVAVGTVLEVPRIARLGLKVGWEHAREAVWDAAAQVDVTVGR